jgi:hypothetical protein
MVLEILLQSRVFQPLEKSNFAQKNFLSSLKRREEYYDRYS